MNTTLLALFSQDLDSLFSEKEESILWLADTPNREQRHLGKLVLERRMGEWWKCSGWKGLLRVGTEEMDRQR